MEGSPESCHRVLGKRWGLGRRGRIERKRLGAVGAFRASTAPAASTAGSMSPRFHETGMRELGDLHARGLAGVPVDAPQPGAVASRASRRSVGPTPSTPGAPTLTPTVAPGESGPLALGVAVAGVAILANGARHRQAGDGPRVASARASPVVDLEEPTTHGTTPSAGRRPRTHSEHVAGQSVVACS